MSLSLELLAYAKTSVEKLTQAGYIAYFAGGWVRDYLMDHPSDDVDIATNAPEEVILKLFPNTIHVGRSFGVYIVPFKGKQLEIAIFRKDIEYTNGRKPSRIEPATPEEDAERRDFTINGMFYDPVKNVVHDWVGGASDISKKIIRTIGDPDERFYEDRLRMLRAVRFATRFNFNIDQDTQQAIIDNAETLFPAVSMERVKQELIKMSHYSNFDHAIIELHRLKILGEIFPELKDAHLNDIKKRVSYFHEFPKKAPLALYLLELFPDKNELEMEELLRSMKLSVKDFRQAEFYILAKELLKEPKKFSRRDFAKFYADPHSEMCLEIAALKEIRTNFLLFHKEMQESLKVHIERIKTKKPLVRSTHLMENGVKEGPAMGRLLREAEALSINEDLHDKDIVIARLKNTTTWRDL